MDKQYNLEDKSIRKTPIIGMTVETFVKRYKGQSQMNVNTINGLDVSGRGAKMVGDIYRAAKKHQ